MYQGFLSSASSPSSIDPISTHLSCLERCQFERGSGFPWKVSRNKASSADATGRKVEEEARRRNEREGAGVPREEG